MARILIFLLCLLLRSNAYAYCYATQWTSYGPVFSSLGVADGTTMQACQQLACQIYPHIPECGMFTAQPACQNQTEYQTLACPIHQSGAINQSRSYNCSAQTWSAWTTTSNNCTQDPPTCHTSMETRQLTCQPGYNGLITESRSSICSDPYGSPTWTAWSVTSDTCTMTATNINNPTSPISPISPTNPNSVISKSINAQSTQTESVTAMMAPAVTMDMTTTTVTTQSSTSTGSTTQNGSSTTTSTSSTSSTTSSQDKKDNVKDLVIPKGKEIVPGFGLVMSMQLLNSSYSLQQQQIQEYINLTQEQEYGREQDFLLDIIASSDIGDHLNGIANYRWRSLLGDNPLQRSGFGN